MLLDEVREGHGAGSAFASEAVDEEPVGGVAGKYFLDEGVALFEILPYISLGSVEHCNYFVCELALKPRLDSVRDRQYVSDLVLFEAVLVVSAADAANIESI